jgi:hypothetical protein
MRTIARGRGHQAASRNARIDDRVAQVFLALRRELGHDRGRGRHARADVANRPGQQRSDKDAEECKFASNSDPLRGIIASNSDPF